MANGDEQNNTLSTTGESESSVFGMFASKIGSGAAKAGKKFAQSEAGRSATRAAVKGATDAATKDLTDRYTKQGSYSNKPAPAPVSPAPTSDSPPVSPHQTDHRHEDEDRVSSPDSYTETRRAPPKPSFMERYKPQFNTKKQSSKPKNTKPRKPSGDRVWKSRLAKEPDWDSQAKAMALFNYRAEMKCDLEFRKGQVISIVFRTDTQNDWWEGKLDGRVGIFPANYVRLM